MGKPDITSHPQKMQLYGFVTNSDIAFTYNCMHIPYNGMCTKTPLNSQTRTASERNEVPDNCYRENW